MPKRLAVIFLGLAIFVGSGFAKEIILIKRASRPDTVGGASYRIEKGDTLWKIFMDKNDVETEDLPYYYKKFRELNPHITDLNHIISGQKIILPSFKRDKEPVRVDVQSPYVYTIKKGQCIARVLRDVYGLSTHRIFNGYLDLIKDLNPDIKDLNHVEPGQKIRMPKLKEQVAAVTKVHDISKDDIEVEPATNDEEFPVEEEEEISTGSEEEPEVAEVYDIEPVAEEPVPQVDIETEEIEEIRVVPRQMQAETRPVEEQDVAEEPKTEKKPQRKIVLEAEPKTVDEVAAVEEKIKPTEEIRDNTEIKPKVSERPSKTEEAAEREKPRASEQKKEIPEQVLEQASAAEAARRKEAEEAHQVIKEDLLPAFVDMGASQKDKGTYFMPMSGGSSISIDTREMPIIEIDTGKKIVLDINNKISPEVKDLVNEAFPACRILSGPSNGLEELMDRVLDVSGYFSINKNASPLLVGEEEKVKILGKWIVYKDYSRRNVFVINILSDKDYKTPQTIKNYASRFGIDLVELGGAGSKLKKVGYDSIRDLNRSYENLLNALVLPYDEDKELELVSVDAIRIAYKAPLISGRVIITNNMPDKTMQSLLEKKHYVLFNSETSSVEDLLKTLGMDIQGPPVKIEVNAGRTDIEVPGFKVGKRIILKKAIDKDIALYLASTGLDVLIW